MSDDYKIEKECFSCKHFGHKEVGSSCIKNQDDDCRGTINDLKFQYNNWEPKIKENKPKKIQTEYEWKKERFDLLCLNCFDAEDPMSDERESLDVWLKENKPENWQQCTRGNTKVWDSITHRVGQSIRIIEHFYKKGRPFEIGLIVVNDGCTSYDSLLEQFEININK